LTPFPGSVSGGYFRYGARYLPRVPLPSGVLPPLEWRLAPLRSALPDLHRYYGLMRQSILLLPPRSLPPCSDGPCRLSRIPAGEWTFPSLSLLSFHRCLAPYPGCPLGALARFFPSGYGLPRLSSGSALTSSAQRLPCRSRFRGCRHSVRFRPPCLFAILTAPTLAHSRGAAMAFSSELPARCYLQASRIY
jgi:hypothetical protein